MAPFGNVAANGDTAAVSDAAAVGDMAPFDVTYEMHAFYPRQYICTLRMARQTRGGEGRRGEARRDEARRGSIVTRLARGEVSHCCPHSYTSEADV